MRISKFAKWISLLMVGMLMLTGCVSKNADEKATTDAKSDKMNGAITVYTALEDDQIKTYLEGFKKQYPDVKVNIVRDSTGVITSKLMAEKDNPQADLVWGLAASSLLVLKNNDMLQGYAPKGVERVAANFKDDAKEPTWVGFDAWMSAFTVNKPELAKRNLPIPQSFADLIDPKYKGLIVMPNPASSGTGFLTVSGILQTMGEEKGWDYLGKLHENIATYVHSGSQPSKMAASGEAAIGIAFDYRGIQDKLSGAPVDVIFPKEGSGWDVEANALLKKKDVKPEAKAFLDWAIGDDIMKLYAKNYAITSVKTDVAIPAGYPSEPLKQLAKNDFSWAAKSRDDILKKWTAMFDSKSAPKK